MDIKVKNKDIVTGENGRVETVEGLSEYLQAAYISFCALKGAFCYQRELGCFKNLSEIENEDELLKEAAASLIDMPHLFLVNAAIESGEMVFVIDTPSGEGEIRIPKAGEI